jgi:hypothetical protein
MTTKPVLPFDGLSCKKRGVYRAINPSELGAVFEIPYLFNTQKETVVTVACW